MRYRKLNNGDYTFGGNGDDFITGTLAVSQAIKTNLLLLQGEWWESTGTGLPLFQHILGAPGTPQHIQATDLLVQDNILATLGVLRIKDFKSIYEDRKYGLSCKVETIYGDAETEVIF
ncbi:hypothetical protein [Paenibacillus agricola]|uniref:Uncharacterized protein n=1 Tax=Paenibacillus agricola TaxID=2716264 RepID=A0ABX0JE90_9BACL|nr:hypothetical protein [Paenibacillus agricola]NHN33574.1 hypothetical protein [Paenibacillus agricola]